MVGMPCRWSSRVAATLFPCLSLLVACGGEDAPAASSPACAKGETSSPPPTPAANEITLVHVDPGASAPLQLAVQACAGLYNREVGGSVYVESDPRDAIWPDELGWTVASDVDALGFLGECVARFPACVRYDYPAQQALLPNILTAAAALGAVPLDEGLDVTCGAPVFDAIQELAGRDSPALATKYVFDAFGAQTTGLAMLNPGYDQQADDVSDPPLKADMGPALVDFVFSQRLFVVFMVNGCVDDHPEKGVLGEIVNAGVWPTPVGVYGYNNSWYVAGGYLYEAQTLCLDSRNMGAIASEARNLSFFSTRAAPIERAGVVTPNPLEATSYDPEKTYVAVVVGDGDNIQYMMTTRHDWFRQRVDACLAGEACPPLTWSISPHLARIAPDLLRWYYDRSHETGRDYFVLPPSGHLYAYPTSLAEEEQGRFVAATEDDACVLGTTGTVHWDWVGTWNDAESHFLPKYARAGGPVRGIFPSNVPYSFPTFTWWPPERFYELVGGADGSKLALFRPRSWRGVNDEKDPYFLTPQKMADEIASYPKGTVAWIYLTSDGGLILETSFLALSELLPPRVELVSTDTAAKLALAAGQR
jgi:hypothetical protein